MIQVLVAAGRDFGTDNDALYGAAIAYYSLLSVFPLLLAGASIAAFFVDPSWVVTQITQLLGQNFLPRGAGQLDSIVQSAIQARGSVSVISLLALLWSVSRFFGVVTQALNIAFDADETYGFIKRTMIELALALSIGLFFVIALLSRLALNLSWDALRFLPPQDLAFHRVAQEAIPGLLLLIAFFLMYRFIPRRKVQWKAALFGALAATSLFLAARPLFTSYIVNFANYNLIYGSLAVAVILVFWAWIVSAILLFGGELASHAQEIIFEGNLPDDILQRHRTRSPARKIKNELRSIDAAATTPPDQDNDPPPSHSTQP